MRSTSAEVHATIQASPDACFITQWLWNGRMGKALHLFKEQVEAFASA